jgi:hypothetical protein
MSRLVANFDIKLPGLCLAAWPEDDEICFNCTINEFEVTVHLVKDSSGRSKGADDKHWTYVIDRALVKVARDEIEDPPAVVSAEKGRRDYTVQTVYFSQRIEQYGMVAREAINRLIRFLKFRLRTPFLQELPPSHHSFRNADWTNSCGKEAGKGSIVFVAKPVPGEWGQLGVQKLKPESVESVQAALTNPIEPTLHEEILSDAQSALFENKLRRAVLELAIACELIVKRSFFSGDSPAGAAFDYLEDKAQVKVTVLDLLHRVAQEAFGKSFREDHDSHYKNIDHLFRCRNKVAHRGELSFRDDRGVETHVDHSMVASWWDSVLKLIEWLF